MKRLGLSRLKALPPETLADMAKTDELELIYMHLHSLRNFDLLRDRLEHKPADAATGPVH